MFKPPPKHIFSMSLCMNELYMSLRHLAEVHISISTATTTCSYITNYAVSSNQATYGGGL
jgi:hypothetical protein